MLTLDTSCGFPYKEYHSELSEDMTIFQTAEMLREFFKNAIVYALPQRKAIRTFTVKDDGEPVLIMPAFINAQETCLAGHANGICELNLIYFRGTEKRLQEYIEFLFGEIKSPKIRIDRVREGSKLAVIMDKGIEGYLIKRRAIENVKIAFNNGYSEWINGLSKSVRQNVRTAYNRLNTDGRMLKMHMVSGGASPSL